MTLNIYTDGGSKGNPGQSAIGIVAYVDEREIFRHREDIGIATNNFAEYSAVLKALELLKTQITNYKYPITKVIFHSDSQLMVNQLNGRYKVKNKVIQNLIFQIRGLEVEIGLPVYYKYIPRELNKVADGLVNQFV